MFVDSSFLVGLARDHDEAVAFYERNPYAEYSAPTVVAYEMLAGLVQQGYEEALNELRHDLDWVDFVGFDLDDAYETAVLEAELEAAGNRIRVSDTMIAAAARRRNETLVASDGLFERVDGLDYVNFREA